MPRMPRHVETWLLPAAGLAALVAGVCWLSGAADAASVTLSVFGIAAALVLAVRMVRQMLAGTFGVDLLAVIAITATVLTGEVVASLDIIVMLGGGSALEAFADRRAMTELTALTDRAPRTARRVVEGGFVDVPADELRIDDLVLVRSGEVVAADGLLVSGRAVVDESPITGESMPVERQRGDPILSGSIVGVRAAELRVIRPARDSQYQAIVALVASASANRAPTVRLADRFAVPFTVVSLLIAGTAWWVSGDPVRFAEVVVLATPCPLLLAAPVAFVAGMSRAARNGVIVKGGAVLESLSRVRTVVLDKTGTLTVGRPAVVRIEAADPWSEADVLTIAASVETLSSHVLAASIVEAAAHRGLTIPPATDAVESEARGITAIVEGRRAAIGTGSFISSLGASLVVPDLSGGELAVYVAIDGVFAGTIVASDPVRIDSAATVRRLRALGVERFIMLTGDAEATAARVARSVGVDEFRADCLPADKVAAVAALARRPVLMVGDGINDAPVLAAAEVGMAMGARGATAASEAADAVILVEDIGRVASAVEISRRTVRIAYQSIGIGIAASLALMLVASFGVIPATLGAGLQEIIDVATILNALRALGRTAERTPAAVPSETVEC